MAEERAMTHLTRRSALLGLAGAFAPALPVLAQDRPKEFRIGYQKTGLPVIARQQGTIEKRLAGQGVAVRWVEFAAGPPLLEAMNAGAVDLGFTGDAPPVFAQAAGASIVYAAALPSNGAGEALIVKKSSPITSLAALKGRKIGFTKGSSAHNLTVAALEKGGVAWSDVTPVYLSPADAAAAFARDSIDAWAIWDPFFALAQIKYDPRVLATSKEVLHVNTYFLANKGFAAREPRIVADALAGFADAAAWAAAHRGEVARSLAEITGVELAAQTLAADRTEFGVLPITDDIIAGQQATADRFHKLGLIPRPISIRDAIWTRPAS
jgi:sulfonate transport system substrate-binding protein